MHLIIIIKLSSLVSGYSGPLLRRNAEFLITEAIIGHNKFKYLNQQPQFDKVHV